MAVTKILARHARPDVAIQYALNGDKTQEQVFTARVNCVEGYEYLQMKATKKEYGKEDGVQSYHIVQSFVPTEISPELALKIAKDFVAEHLPGYEAVIGVHVDKDHIHSHIVFNSVCAADGTKYHSNKKSYYQQIRKISDRLCAEHGLSVVMRGESSKAMSYIEWLREKRGQPTYRSMLEGDLRLAIEDANDYGHFLVLMEGMGYEVKHGNRLSFRLRGQEHFIVPGRRNPLFTEDGIRKAIQGEQGSDRESAPAGSDQTETEKKNERKIQMINEYSLNISTEEKNLLTGALLNLKMDLISERSDYRDVSELLDKISKQCPLQRGRGEAR